MKALKLLGSAWVWFCVATVLGQAGLIGVLASKGWLTRDRVVRVRAALDGMETPKPATEEVAAPQPLPWAALEQETSRLAAADPLVKSRIASSNEAEQDVRDIETRLETDRQRFDEMRRSFDKALSDMERETLESGLQDVRQTLENMSPKQAKEYVTRMHVAGAAEDLVKVFSSLTIDKRKKIVGEFRTPAEQQTLHEILRDVRLSNPLDASQPTDAATTPENVSDTAPAAEGETASPPVGPAVEPPTAAP